MTIPNERMAVISTAHLPENEAEEVSELIETGAITGMKREYGWLIHTKPLSYPARVQVPHLNYVLGYLFARDFPWVMFDCDADKLPDIPAFDW